MKTFKDWVMAKESTAAKRAAMNPGIPAQAGLVFIRPPGSVASFCKKIKSPGVRIDNMNTTDLCDKKSR